MSIKTPYPSIARLVAIIDKHKATLDKEDIKELCRVKNWLRLREDNGLSASKVGSKPHTSKARGAAI
jgi:hypothetical protein